MVSNTTLQKNLDAFYTHPKIARFCLDLLKDLIAQNLGLDLNAFHFLEPSAGSGSFVDALKSLKNALKDLENPFGFAPYIRKAYEHKKEFSNHHQIESFFSSNHILREQNVLEFLKTISH